MRKERKRSITLIELIIVMILIATITGAVAYNYRDSLNEGRAFKTKEMMSRIETIVAIYYAEHPEEIHHQQQDSWKGIVRASPLIKNPEEYLNDGWGSPFQVDVLSTDSGVDIKVTSKEYSKYLAKKKSGK